MPARPYATRKPLADEPSNGNARDKTRWHSMRYLGFREHAAALALVASDRLKETSYDGPRARSTALAAAT